MQIAYTYCKQSETSLKRKLGTMGTSFSRKNLTVPRKWSCENPNVKYCIKRNLPATEQNFVTLLSFMDKFHCTFLLLLQVSVHINLRYERREAYLFSA